MPDELAHRVAAQGAPTGAGEDRVTGISGSLAEPGTQDRHGVAGQRDGPFLTSFAEDLDVRAAPEGDVGGAHCGQLRDPQAGLHGEGEQARSRRPAQRPASGAFSSASASSGSRKLTSGRSRRLDGIASTRAMSAACSGWRRAANANHERSATSLALRVAMLTPLFLQVSEEPADRVGVEVLEAELGRLLPAGLGQVGEQQPEAVPVGGNGVGWPGAGRSGAA